MSNTTQEESRLVSITEVCRRLSISEPGWRRLQRKDPRAPRGIQVGDRAVRYLESDLTTYVAQLIDDARHDRQPATQTA